MNLHEQISRIKQVMRLDERTQPKQIYVDMGGVLFPSSANDEVQQGTTERPEDVKAFQTWVIDEKNDNQILGKYGADGKWGKKTSNAWLKYGEEYKTSVPSVKTQNVNLSNFIGSELWRGLKQHNPMILTSIGTSNPKEKKERKLNQAVNILGLPKDRVIFVTHGRDKANYAQNGILIDDSPENIKAWNNNGGIGILHQNNQKTLQTLNSLMSPAV
jgi:hypothetical protein